MEFGAGLDGDLARDDQVIGDGISGGIFCLFQPGRCQGHDIRAKLIPPTVECRQGVRRNAIVSAALNVLGSILVRLELRKCGPEHQIVQIEVCDLHNTHHDGTERQKSSIGRLVLFVKSIKYVNSSGREKTLSGFHGARAVGTIRAQSRRNTTEQMGTKRAHLRTDFVSLVAFL